jgi:GNAT superfamily N-acetyltransferase
MTDYRWRQMTNADLDAVERIASIVHPGFFERREVLAEKQQLYPSGAWVCENEGKALGYFLTHPWHRDAIPALDTTLEMIPRDADTYYCHDLALLPEARGSGATRAAVETALAHAASAGFRTASLVAVNGSQTFWQRHGFAAVDAPHLAEELAAYEPGARYMMRAV